MAKPDQATRRAKRAAAMQRRLTRGANKLAAKQARALTKQHKEQKA